MLKKITAFAIGLSALAAVACGSSDAPSDEPTSTPMESAESTSTATTGTSDPTATTDPTEPITSNRPIPEPGDAAPGFVLPSATSSDVTLSELTAEGPVVVVFYRAFW